MSNAKNLTAAEKFALAKAMLNTNWNDIEDIPEYELIPVGTYSLRCTKSVLDIVEEEGKQSLKVSLHFEILDTQELAKPYDELTGEGDKAPAKGTLVMFSYVGDYGIRNMKRDTETVSLQMGWETPTETIDNFENTEVVAVIKQRIVKGKDGKEDRTFNAIDYMQVPGIEIPAPAM